MKRVCKKCGKEKELEEFRKKKTSKDGHTSECKLCYNERSRDYKKKWAKNRTSPRKRKYVYKDKTCFRCKCKFDNRMYKEDGRVHYSSRVCNGCLNYKINKYEFREYVQYKFRHRNNSNAFYTEDFYTQRYVKSQFRVKPCVHVPLWLIEQMKYYLILKHSIYHSKITNYEHYSNLRNQD